MDSSNNECFNTVETINNNNKENGTIIDDQPRYLKKFNNYKYNFSKNKSN